MPFQGVASAQTIVNRPLDKGMVLNQPSQVIPEGAFLELENFIASQRGLKRRPGYDAFAGGQACKYSPLDMVTVWNTAGSQTTVVITEKTLWRASISGYNEVAFEPYSTGTIAVSGLSIVGSGTLWATADILPGDLIRVGSYEGVVKEVTSNTTIDLESSNIPDQSGASYKVVATFTPGYNEIPDVCVLNNYVLIADGRRPLLAYDATTQTLGYWVDSVSKYPNSVPFIAGSVAVYGDRIWTGDTLDATDGRQMQRIRWSSLADQRNFNIATNYVDLPYMNGQIKRLVPLDRYLMAYTNDLIFIGTPTNFPLAPVRFDPMETGGIGLLGSRAVVGYVGAHFWIGQDDIYMTTPQGVKRIGSPVMGTVLPYCTYPEKAYTILDPFNNCVLFGIPQSNPFIESIWRYEYRAEAWSYDDVSATMLANPGLNQEFEWNDLTGTWDNLGTIFNSWSAMTLDDPRRYIFRAWNGILYRQSIEGSQDADAGVIEAVLVTKDFDYNEPDKLKSWVRTALKLDEITVRTVNITFAAEVSVNKGRTWKSIGNLVIGPQFDEGYLNLKALGSTFRLRLTTGDNVSPYYISEQTYRVRPYGAEHDVSTQG